MDDQDREFVAMMHEQETEYDGSRSEPCSRPDVERASRERRDHLVDIFLALICAGILGLIIGWKVAHT